MSYVRELAGFLLTALALLAAGLLVLVARLLDRALDGTN